MILSHCALCVARKGRPCKAPLHVAGDMVIIMNVTDSEWKILDKLWAKPMSLAELTRSFEGTTDWSRHTIISFLHRMEQKGTVASTTEGRTQIFYPLITKDCAVTEATEDYLGKVFQNNPVALFNFFVDKSIISSEEANEIRDAIDKL